MASHITHASRAGLAALLAFGVAAGCSRESGEDAAPAAKPVVAAAPVAAAPAVAEPVPRPANPDRSFASFEAVDQSYAQSPMFVFSAGPATAASPIVITAKDRALTPADRDHRTGLQRQWLEVNVPDHFEFGTRATVECGPVAGHATQACDRFTFNDSLSGDVHEYFLFVGNWPD